MKWSYPIITFIAVKQFQKKISKQNWHESIEQNLTQLKNKSKKYFKICSCYALNHEPRKTIYGCL